MTNKDDKEILLSTKIEDLGLSERAESCLKCANIIFVYELVTMPEIDLLRTPNLGRKVLNEIKEVLSNTGLTLGMSVENINIEANEFKSYRKHLEKEAKKIEFKREPSELEILKWASEIISDREYNVLELRFLDNLTLEEIGKRFGVTRERIRQIEAKALRKIKHPSGVNLNIYKRIYEIKKSHPLIKFLEIEDKFHELYRLFEGREVLFICLIIYSFSIVKYNNEEYLCYLDQKCFDEAFEIYKNQGKSTAEQFIYETSYQNERIRNDTIRMLEKLVEKNETR